MSAPTCAVNLIRVEMITPSPALPRFTGRVTEGRVGVLTHQLEAHPAQTVLDLKAGYRYSEQEGIDDHTERKRIMPLFAPSTILKGFGLGMSLIVAIGAQNAYVLRQGLKREFHLLVALVCTLSDMILITVGVAGVGTLFSQSALLKTVAFWGGALFLLIYGLLSFRSAIKPGAMTNGGDDRSPTGAAAAALSALAFSWLNPHVYLDTVVLIGGLGAQFPAAERFSFGLGAVLASTVWFFGLAVGAARLAPLFQRPITWRILDSIIGLIMWGIAGSLLLEVLTGGGA